MEKNINIAELPENLHTSLSELVDSLASLVNKSTSNLDLVSVNTLPSVPAVYVIRSADGLPLVVDFAKDLRAEMQAVTEGDPTGKLIIIGLCGDLPSDRKDAQEHVRNKCTIQFVLANDVQSSSPSKHFAIAVLKPKYNLT